MPNLLIVLIALVAWAWLFFLLYIGSMSILRAYHEGKLGWFLYTLVVPFITLAWIYDMISNMTVISVIYGELPRQWTVTARLKRHIDKDTRRGKLSRFICKKMLSPFDHTGDHCD